MWLVGIVNFVSVVVYVKSIPPSPCLYTVYLLISEWELHMIVYV